MATAGVASTISTPSPSTSADQSTSTLSSLLSKGKSKYQPPSSSTFSFKAPLLSASSSSTSNTSTTNTSGATTPVKLRRVSMALASSPRLVPESAWSFRDDTGIDTHVGETCLMPEKKGKMRKIAKDTDDDIQTEKKLRKKWSAEETQMLVDGCNKHGVGNWKTILGDPEFKFVENRSPVDLKDRFRTYFPDAYKKHYPNARTHLSSKIRSTLPDGSSLFEKTRSKKRRPFTEEEDRALKAGYEKHGTVWAAIVRDPIFQEQNRRSTDLRDRFRNAYPDLYQAAGYKPRNAAKKKLQGAAESSGHSLAQAKMPVRAATDDQLAMSTLSTTRRRRRNTSQGLLRGGTKSVPQSASPSEDEDSDNEIIAKPSRTTRSNSNPLTAFASISKVASPPSTASSTKDILNDDMGLISMDTDPFSDALPLSDFPDTSQSEIDAQSQTWSSGLDTPVHSLHAWAGSPTSSHLSSDHLLSSQSSPFQSRNDSIVGGMGMIGKSAWGTQDWFSANPRLDNSGSAAGSSALDGGFSPSSPFSFSHLNHGIFDRYDLMPVTNPHDFSSEVGIGDSRSTFSDDMFPPSSGFRGFTHHSDYAGDLIFGARTHQPQGSSYYGTGFGTLGTEGQTMGLGLSGIGPSTGINPMQLHTPALPGIDEIELTGITLDDNAASQDVDDSGIDMDVLHVHSPTKEDGLHKPLPPQHHPHFHLPPPRPQSVMSDTRLNFDDLVDMSGEAHITPPGTPLSPSRQLRKRSVNYNNHFSRSISVPPGERNQLPSPPSRPTQQQSLSQPDVLSDRRHFFRSDAHTSQDDSHMSVSPSSRHHHPHQAEPSSPPLLHSMHNPPTFSSLFLASASQGQLNGHPSTLSADHGVDNNNLPFLDLHYGGTTMAPPPSMDESQNYRQALDLAQSIASSLTKPGTPSVPVGQPSTPGPTRVFRGRTSLPAPHRMPTPTMSPAGRMITSNHHRGQSAVCPQDLMVRSEGNKRKRASWDGAHLLDSVCQ